MCGLCLSSLSLTQSHRTCACTCVPVCLQASEAWHSLDRSQVELVASQLAAEMASLRRLLGEMEPPSGMGAPPKRRGWW